MLKKIGLTLAIILCFISAGLFYINKVLLPVHVKGLIIRSAQDALGRTLTFNTINFNPVKGLVLTDVVLSTRNNPNEPFVQIREASCQALLFPLLQKKVIIPSIRLDGLSVTVVRFEDGQWSFNDLLTMASPKAGSSTDPNAKPPFDVLISGFQLTNATITVQDRTSTPVFQETLTPINVKGTLALNASVTVSGNIGFPETKGDIRFDGRMGMTDQSLKGSFHIRNLVAARYLRFIPPLPITIERLTIADADIDVFQSADGLTVSGSGAIPEFDVAAPQGIAAQGHVAFNKVFATLSPKGAINAQGTVQTDRLILNLPNQTTLNGKFKLSLAKFSSDASSIQAAGALTGDQVTASMAGVAASGDIRSNDAAVDMINGKISAHADLAWSNMVVTLNQGQTMKGNLSIPRADLRPSGEDLLISLNGTLNNAQIRLTPDQSISGDITIPELSCVFSGSDTLIKTALDIKKLEVLLPTLIARTDIKMADVSASWRNGILDAGGRLSFKGLSVDIPKTLGFEGSPEITGTVTFNPASNPPLSYAGRMTLENGSMTHLPYVDTASAITTTVAFEPDEANIQQLSLRILDTPLSLKGKIKNYANPFVSMDMKAPEVNLALAEKIVPDLFKQQGLSVSGRASLDVRMVGLILKPLDAKITATVTLNDTAAKSYTLNQAIDHVNGTITYETPNLSWKDLSLVWQERKFLFNGHLQDLLNPAIVTSIKTNDLSADIDVHKTAKGFRVRSLSGSYFDSSFDGNGDITLTDKQPPYLDVSATCKLALRDLPKILPAQAKEINALNLAGIAKIKAEIKGRADDWPNWNSTVSVDTPALYVMGYQIENIALKAIQKDGRVDPLNLDAVFYGGAVTAKGNVMLTEKRFPFETSFKADQINLELLKKATPLKTSQLAGLVNANGDIKGNALDIRNIEGKTTVSIKQGYLWDCAVLSNVLKILSSSFQGGDIVITDADATLNFGNARVMTDDLTLKSQTVTITGQGWVDWDQNIEFSVSPRLDVQTTSNGTVNAIQALNPTNGLINIRVYNTLKEPKIEHNISAPQIIKKTLQNTVGGLLKIFE